MNSVYGIFVDDPEPTCIYVGTTKRDVEIRLKEHKREARRGKIEKPLYFYLRKRDLIEQIYIVTLQTAEVDEDVERWEQDWVDEFRKLGHPITNAKEGNAQVLRPKNTFNEMWNAINNAAYEKLATKYPEPTTIYLL